MATINAINSTINSSTSGVTVNSSSGVLSTVATTNHGVLLGNSSGQISSLAAAATGATLMGSTGADPAFTGSPSFSGSVTAGTTLTASSGAITATSGNVVITSGNLTLPATSSSVGQIQQPSGTRMFHTFGTENIFLGSGAGNFTTTGQSNVVIGANGVGTNMGASANGNVFIGAQAAQGATTAAGNVAIGFQAYNGFSASQTGNTFNVAIGYAALGGASTTTAAFNTIVGGSSGGSYTTSDSSNILLGYSISGTGGTSNRLIIGNGTGTGNGNINVATICGITGKTSTSGVAVLVNSSNVLGTTTSSIRFKENIQDMGNQSSDIFKLRPVTFTYKASKPHVDEEGSKLRQFGLIAEEVEQVMPDQVTYNLDGNIESVRYLNFIPMLINEIQKLRKEVEELKRSL